MNDSPYIRPNLTATNKGVADGALLVDCWLDRLVDLHEGRGSSDPRADAYDMLATWARLKRSRPDVFSQLNRHGEWERLDREIDERRKEIAPQALVAKPTGWLDEAKEFYDAIDGDASAVELRSWAERLLTDLDDADLVAWAAQPWVPAATIRSGLDQCYQWLADHIGAFVLCSVYVQAVGMAISPDLANIDADLVWTADKFVLVLDASEEAEANLAFSGNGAFTADEVRELLQQGSGSRRANAGLLTAAEIRKGIEQLGLEHQEVAEHLGVPPKTIVGWINGAIVQSGSEDKLLRLYFALPEARAILGSPTEELHRGTLAAGHRRIDKRFPALARRGALNKLANWEAARSNTQVVFPRRRADAAYATAAP